MENKTKAIILNEGRWDKQVFVKSLDFIVTDHVGNDHNVSSSYMEILRSSIEKFGPVPYLGARDIVLLIGYIRRLIKTYVNPEKCSLRIVMNDDSGNKHIRYYTLLDDSTIVNDECVRYELLGEYECAVSRDKWRKEKFTQFTGSASKVFEKPIDLATVYCAKYYYG